MQFIVQNITEYDDEKKRIIFIAELVHYWEIVIYACLPQLE